MSSKNPQKTLRSFRFFDLFFTRSLDQVDELGGNGHGDQRISNAADGNVA